MSPEIYLYRFLGEFGDRLGGQEGPKIEKNAFKKKSKKVGIWCAGATWWVGGSRFSCTSAPSSLLLMKPSRTPPPLTAATLSHLIQQFQKFCWCSKFLWSLNLMYEILFLIFKLFLSMTINGFPPPRLPEKRKTSTVKKTNQTKLKTKANTYIKKNKKTNTCITRASQKKPNQAKTNQIYR